MILVDIVLSLACVLPFQFLFWAWKYPAVVPSPSGANWTASTTRIRPAFQPFQVGVTLSTIENFTSEGIEGSTDRYRTDFLQGFFCTTKLFVKNFRIWLKISLKRSFQRPDLMSQKIRFCKLSKEVPILSLWIDRFGFALTAAKSHLSQHHFCDKIA